MPAGSSGGVNNSLLDPLRKAKVWTIPLTVNNLVNKRDGPKGPADRVLLGGRLAVSSRKTQENKEAVG